MIAKFKTGLRLALRYTMDSLDNATSEIVIAPRRGTYLYPNRRVVHEVLSKTDVAFVLGSRHLGLPKRNQEGRYFPMALRTVVKDPPLMPANLSCVSDLKYLHLEPASYSSLLEHTISKTREPRPLIDSAMSHATRSDRELELEMAEIIWVLLDFKAVYFRCSEPCHCS